MTMLPVTLSTAIACALLSLWLALRIGRIRRGQKIFVGDGGNDALQRRMRAQANFVEYAPFVLILLGLVEMARGTHAGLWAAAAVFVAARVAHPFGMDGSIPARAVGVLATFAVLLGLAIYGLVILFGSGTPGGAIPVQLPQG